ncbi:Carboxysome shell and ethanolamine utilization microcompartment protein CcmL/EutN [Clostridium cavendishii DSM 21758]|uniref:Carboxysome shell and ethanolamine utilization microcompartment protein CcmL/EutN n=1 Tax=Clostridium cavendishii DSM 21758 TaxID=1121302 RepID=A0A1M6HP71_9CLOT|nr:BMC domain-containing protein [Clostridium cavendishii]SHJ23923.1 Carboxysome shell and ethanolamine utilization microcompartment protein CcmL/EutN [Clostridium cavendishii DSM 21758]
MQALGLIETKGLLAAIESVDVMLKAADVSIFEKTYVGGGLVSVAVTGDVGAVKAAVEAGAAAVKNLDPQLLVSEHVIPRPHNDLDNIIGMENKQQSIEYYDEEIKDNDNIVEISNETAEIEEVELPKENLSKENLSKENLQEEKLKEENLQDKQLSYVPEIDINNIKKVTVDKLVEEIGIDKTIEVLNKLTVSKLKELILQYENIKVTSGKLSKASKKLLITKIKESYK